MKWVYVFILSLFSLLLLGEGIGLWTVLNQAEGTQFGIGLFGIDIKNDVFKENMPGYALGFSVASIIPIMVAGTIVIKDIHRK
ncbi:hypothetical protein AB1K84_16565 [Mesobacillus foraminis]|uniref:hypothetical protein n=1 Tax=Mesobacillus foraminis TaxID=279826 RepID=UPI0039A2C1C2